MVPVVAPRSGQKFLTVPASKLISALASTRNFILTACVCCKTLYIFVIRSKMRKGNMKILVTGASGFLGTALCSYLEQKNHEITRLSSKNCDLTKQGNLNNYRFVSYDQIYHPLLRHGHKRETSV